MKRITDLCLALTLTENSKILLQALSGELMIKTAMKLSLVKPFDSSNTVLLC